MTNFQIKSKNNINYNYTNFVSKYDYWIFELDNTLYDINLGLFRRISKRMTEYIKKFFDLEHDKALSLQKNMYKKYGLTLRGLMIEKNMDPEPYLKYVHDVHFDDLKIDNELKNLLVRQIESRVRWRESVLLMINKGINQFIEIGPGKVLSSLIKRIDNSVKVSAINTEEDIKLINIDE